MPSPQSFYNDYHRWNRNSRYSKLVTKHNFTYFYIFELLVPLLNKLDRPRVLDVGCGVGTLSLFMSQWARGVLGIDISPQAIEIAEQARSDNGIKHVRFVAGELTPMPQKFELVVCSEVIEHVPDDQGLLQLIHRNLKPGGYLFLTTPSRDNWLTRIGYFTKFDARVGHLRRYSQAELVAQLEQAGFETVRVRSVEGLPRMILFSTKLGLLIKLIRGPLIPLFHLLDRVSVTIFGAHDIQVVARKKLQLA